MNRTVLAVALFILALLSVACVTSVSPASPPSDQPQPSAPSAVGRTPPPPSGTCQSRLFGKIANETTGQAPPNVSVEISSGSFKAKTVTDKSGLYGFAGLCAGKYTMTMTLPGGKPMVASNPITLDGAEPVKQDLLFK